VLQPRVLKYLMGNQTGHVTSVQLNMYLEWKPARWVDEANKAYNEQPAQTDRQMDRQKSLAGTVQTDRQTDGQTDRHVALGHVRLKQKAKCTSAYFIHTQRTHTHVQ
jgi:hypothetical protein